MKSSKRLFALAVLTAALFSATFSPAAARIKPKITFNLIAKINQPTVVTSAPGIRKLVFATSRLGKIRIIKDGKLLPRPLLNIKSQVESGWIEQGLLGLAFPPDFKKTGRYYVQYTAKGGDNKIDEYQVNPKHPTSTILKTRRHVLRIPAVAHRGNHNGGPLEFHGNLLYISVGDGNNPGDYKNLAQNVNSLRGKILRIYPKQNETTGRTYQTPPTNPFVNKDGRDEIFAYGLRNPHSFDFYKPTGGETQMVITDVGQSRQEEINYLPARLAWGGNFGWHDFEGTLPFNCGQTDCPGSLLTTAVTPKPGLRWPQLTYGHDSGCSIIGGPVVTDPKLPLIKDRIIYGDFCSNRTRTALPNPAWITDDKFLGTYMPPGKGHQPALNGFGEDQAHHVYAFSNFGGIYRLGQTRIKVKRTKAEVKIWCAKKKNKKKRICVKLKRRHRAKLKKAKIKKRCAKKKNASKKICRKSSKKPAKSNRTTIKTRGL
ncbi:MAG: PQQ-dependent sugar dehydrogenase [Solirubrobacterales bacterium]|nr:PQQ-dependent sugar dehydrogenase [Solirubrobacterales bacterium]